MLNQSATINGQKAIVYSPDIKKPLPTVVFIPGAGGSILQQGPGPFLLKGWAPTNLNVICVDPNVNYPSPASIKATLAEVKKIVSVSSLGMSGLSAGMGSILDFIKDGNHGLSFMVVFSYSPAANQKIYKNYPRTWALSGDADRYTNLLTEMVNGIKAAGIEARLTVYKGGHSNWQDYYNPEWKQDGQSIYDWMAGGVVSVPEPVPEIPELPTSGKKIMLPVREGGIYVTDLVNKLKPKEGDVLVIPTGAQSCFLKGFIGSPEAYIIIEHEDPTAVWGRPGAWLFSIEDARFYHVRNININAGPEHEGFNLACGVGTSDYTIENYTSRYGTNGLKCSWNPITGNPATYGKDKTINNVVIRNVDIQDTISEGAYIGNTRPINETTAEFPARIMNLTVENIKTARTGWDGLQIAHAGGLKMKNIYVEDYGLIVKADQRAGVLIGGYVTTDGIIENLTTKRGTGAGLTIFGRGKMHFKDFTLENGYGGIYSDDYADGGMGLDPQELTFENGTISGTTGPLDIEIRNAKGTAKKATFINVKATTVKDATGGWGGVVLPPKPEPPAPVKKLLAEFTVKVYDDGSKEIE